MICPNCQSSEGTYQEFWDEHWDGEEETTVFVSNWTCDACQHWATFSDEGYEYGDD
jgi:hypothetical protein